MIVVYTHDGQLCNRLWALLPILAYAIHKRVRLLNFFAYDKYLRLFPNLRESEYITFVCPTDYLYPQGIVKYVKKILSRWDDAENCDLRDFEHKQFVSCIDGWEHCHDRSYIMEHLGLLQTLLLPSFEVRNMVDTFFDGKNKTIGLHIRRGDYKTYCNGVYYFDDDVWLRIINRMKDQLGNNIRFLICSNESVDFVSKVDGCFSIPNSNTIMDLYALSKCDYIIGPPSSFSQWASFVGRKPLKFILGKDDNVALESFSIIDAFDHFENGKRIVFDVQNERYGYE